VIDGSFAAGDRAAAIGPMAARLPWSSDGPAASSAGSHRAVGARRVPHRAAAEREAEGADSGVGDLRTRGEPREKVACVLILARAVEAP